MAATASLTIPRASPLPESLGAPPAKRSKPMRVPPKISIADLTPNNIGTLRKLNSVLFPVAYSDKFYKEVLSPELEDYCKLVFYNDIPVGAICCRIEHIDSEAGSSSSTGQQPTGKLYLMTLGVLAPYRRQGLATELLRHVQAKAKEASLAASLTSTSSSHTSAASTNAALAAVKTTTAKGKGKAPPVATNEPAGKREAPLPLKPSPILKSIFVHVQTNNEDAKLFWQAQGFSEKETIKDYYKKNIEGPRDAWVLEQEIEI